MKNLILQMIREEVAKAMQTNEEAVSKTVTLDTKTMEAIAQAVEFALYNGKRKLNGIDSMQLLQQIIHLAHSSEVTTK